jgi:hypothetical protein
VVVIERMGSVGTATGYGFDCRGSVPSTRPFPFFTVSRQALGPIQPSTEWVSWSVSQRIKRPVGEAGLSPPPSTKVRNMAAVRPFPQPSSQRDA